MWFYEHTTQFRDHVDATYPRIAKWDGVNHGGHYDAYALLEGMNEEEIHAQLLG